MCKEMLISQRFQSAGNDCNLSGILFETHEKTNFSLTRHSQATVKNLYKTMS
ncbi:MAG: hypothetical protein IK065_03280 [Neisseriaceae bacterium]|nr:hypothetical protein [Neisseriaceae bacterium]